MTAAETRALRAVGDAVACTALYVRSIGPLRRPALLAASTRLRQAFADINRMPAATRPRWRSKVARMRNWITAEIRKLETTHAKRA